MKLSANRVEELFSGSLSETGTVVEGLQGNYALDIAGHEDEIKAMLSELPDEFHAKRGGGWSFLNACNTRDGEQWTGMHQTMEQLFVLGIAAGLAKWLMPRDMWSAFPGGMPYVSVDV
ncbi:hypothetical protein [uncultured Paraglaciecola sp.]|uniref:hypothetical protein n=1 Tax=uncultured Paraglaciecola sp. TaxID=1765024 RepID=UPI00261B61EA|nr:hypothetical protein [uncultured Paraglaciecola sp.]